MLTEYEPKKSVVFSVLFLLLIYHSKLFLVSGLRKAVMEMGYLLTGPRFETSYSNNQLTSFNFFSLNQGAWSRHHSGLGHARSPQFGGQIHFDAGERWVLLY